MRSPLRSAVASTLLPIAALACGGGEPAPSSPLTLGEIAAAWSGGRTDPTCRTHGPRGEHLGPLPGAEHCEWPTVVRGGHRGTVTGFQDALAGLTMITWERTIPDSTAASVLVDSLDAAFTAWGLQAYDCPDGGRRWQQPTLGIQLSPVPSTAAGMRMMVVATTIPSALHEVTCRGAPTLPLEDPRRAPAPRAT